MILFDPELGSPEKTDRKSGRIAAVSRLERVPSQRTLAAFLREARAAVRLRGEVSVLLTSDKEIRRLNRRFRGKNKATDVLSFPAGGIVPDFAGDLAISVETALKQARAQGHSLSTEIKVLVLHGLLHLAGYDHETDDGQMARRERVLRGRLRLPQGLIERAGNRVRGTGYGVQGSRTSAVVLSHPSGKNKDAARVGHPAFEVSLPRPKIRTWGTRADRDPTLAQKARKDGAPLNLQKAKADPSLRLHPSEQKSLAGDPVKSGYGQDDTSVGGGDGHGQDDSSGQDKKSVVGSGVRAGGRR